MKFGIFYELQLPRPWHAGDELKLYQDALTQLETADRLGYDYVGGGASFSGRILTFPLAGILSRRRQPAHRQDQAWPWHLPAYHQPSRTRCRARCRTRPLEQRPRRVRNG